MIFCGPLLDEGRTSKYQFWLHCDSGLTYPFRFLFIWASDFICAFFSIVVIMYEKRFVTDKARLRIARKMDI